MATSAFKEISDLKQEEFLQAEEKNRLERKRADGDGGSGQKKKPLIIVTLLLLIVGAIFLLWHYLGSGYETTDDAFIDGHVVQVSPRVAARVVKVHIDDNYEVKKGDLLVELDPRDFQVALEKAQAQLLQAQAQVKQARAGVLQAGAQLAQAEAQLTQQTAQFEIAEINFNRNASLYQRDMRAVAKEQVDQTKASFDAARSLVEAAKANVEAVRAAAESQQAQVGAAQAAVHVAEAAVDDATLQLSYTSIYAASPGRVTHKSVEPGDYVQPAQTLFSIVGHDVWVTANFKETQLARMRQGQPVEIKVDAFPDRTFHGHVDSFQLGTGSRFSLFPAENATGNYVKVVQRSPVKIVFDDPLADLVWLALGMSVEPKVNITAGRKPSEHPFIP